MSGTTARRPPGTNVVPMSAPGSAPTPQLMAYPWPMPPGGFPAGCCPPGGMDALLQCYCDVQAATAFISKVVQDLAANDPAFQQSLVDAIVASGSNIPLIGVTNGADAQPGQVGEMVSLRFDMPFLATAQSQTVTFGILQPGDWDYWCYGTATVALTGVYFAMPTIPAGFNDPLWTSAGEVTGATQATIVSSVGRALTTLPTLIVLNVSTNFAATGAGPGTLEMWFRARRRR